MLGLSSGAAFLAVVSALVSAEVPTKSPTSCVKGKAFDRFVTVWLENTDYDKAVGDPNLAWLAKKGLTLSNYFAVTHPSLPNYLASIGGDYWGIDNDDKLNIPQNVSTIIDLLADKKISFGSYQEDMPSTGFLDDWKNPKTKANMYVRKHNPMANYASCSSDPSRLGTVKNLTYFHQDLKNDRLPQWMFITPNMTSDGHDTSVTVAGTWARTFLEPLLNDKKFMKRTLVLVTFDENHTYTQQNRVMGILLGDALPKELVGKTDSNFYTHYSEIATVSANWDLKTLGRYDTGANVFEWVAKHSNDKLRQPKDLNKVFLNMSYPGIFNEGYGAPGVWAPQPVPNVDVVVNHRSVLGKIKNEWWSKRHETVYTNLDVVPPSNANPPVYPAWKRPQ